MDERENEDEDEDEAPELLELSTVSHLSLLTHLLLDGNVSGDCSSLLNLTQLQYLNLGNTQVSGSLSFLQNLTQLQVLYLSPQVSGSLSFLQNLTHLQRLDCHRTKVSGSVTSLPRLTGLRILDVRGTQVGVPSEEQLETFDQQHRNCAIAHDLLDH